jgi:phospholipase D3/4
MKAYLVESIPWGLEELRGVEGVVYTEEVLVRLVEGARHAIDLMAMYWSLLPGSDAPDEGGLAPERLAELGADHGRRLFRALEDAVRRGVRVRVLQSPGFREGPQESERLAALNPALVEVRPVDLKAWYGAGIMHQKLWLFDGESSYLGSANADWRSLTQVKELGVVVENHPRLTADLGRYFDGWWHFAGLPELSVKEAWDPAVELERRVPAWSALVPEGEREPSPLDRPDYRAEYNLVNPAPLEVAGRPGGAFVTGSPPELCGPGRTIDLEALLHTIQDARRSVCVSVMTYYPGGRYPRPGEETFIGVWWPLVSDTLLRAAVTRGLSVRLLVAHWAHSGDSGLELLRALQRVADAATSEEREAGSAGRLEIRLFRVPGWDLTAGPARLYPDHSRVNHPKYVVTDRRLHLSTSNLTWGYFAHTAGCSFNTDQLELVEKAQELFDRDWASPNAHPLGGEAMGSRTGAGASPCGCSDRSLSDLSGAQD